MAALGKLLAVLALAVAIKQIANSRRACVCVGPLCACGYR